MIRAKSFERIPMRSTGYGAHRNQVGEEVTPVNVHPLGNRPDRVRGILVAVIIRRMNPAPGEVSVRAELRAANVMLIAGFAVQQLRRARPAGPC